MCEAKQCLSTSPCLSGLSSLFTISPSTQTKRPIWGGWRKRNDGGSLQLIRRSGAARLHRGARRTKRAGKPSLCLWSGTGGEEDREREDASHPILAAGPSLSPSPFFFPYHLSAGWNQGEGPDGLQRQPSERETDRSPFRGGHPRGVHACTRAGCPQGGDSPNTLCVDTGR